MLKRSIFVLLGILAMASITFAGIAQQQNFDIQVTTFDIALVDGIGAIASTNLSTVGHQQNAIGFCGLMAREVERVKLEQGGYVAGTGGVLSVSQPGTAMGGQSQLIDSCVGPMAHGQMFNVDIGQDVTLNDAIGIATGSQSFLGIQRQEMASLSATMAESQDVDVEQSTVVSGGPATSASVTSGIVVYAAQAQEAD